MRFINKGAFTDNSFIDLKNNDWLDKQRKAGKIVAKTLSLLENLVLEKTNKSLIELDALAENFIISQGAVPTFKGYKNFPAAVCISVNKELVHGIPKDYKLQDGDIVSFDLGATVDGAIADSAITCIFGAPKEEAHEKLLKVGYESLIKGIDAVKIGNRLGSIGEAIYKHARANGFGVVTEYGGHGLSWNTPHTAPFVENKSLSTQGIRIQQGLAIAIEPMLTLGSPKTKVLSDGWTVISDNIGCHYEHSIFVHDNTVEILTDRDNL